MSIDAERGSFLDELNAKREAKRRAKKPLILPIPETGGMLAARYRIVDSTYIDAVTAARDEQDDRGVGAKLLDATLKLLVEACCEIYGRLEAGQPWEHVGDGFDFDAAEALRLGPVDTALGIPLRLMDGNWTAIVEHGAEVQRWMGNTDREIAGSIDPGQVATRE